MNSIFKSNKRDEALERLAIGITEGAKNCTTVIKKINTLCQNPEKYPNPFELINEWSEYFFSASSKANSSFWNKQKKIDAIVFSSDLMMVIYKVMPSYRHQYQSDLFMKYTADFLKRLPTAFKKFNDNFYEVGTYLHRYFQWSNK